MTAPYIPSTSDGTQIFYGSTSTTCTIEITNITKTNVPTDKYPKVDYAHLGSSRRTYITGLPDGDELSFSYQWQAAQFNTVNGLKNDSSKWWKVAFPDTSGDILFNGTLLENDADHSDPDGIGEVSCKVVVNSAQTITVGS